jgi:hypothetical protein
MPNEHIRWRDANHLKQIVKRLCNAAIVLRLRVDVGSPEAPSIVGKHWREPCEV